MLPETRYAKSGDLNIAYQVVGDGPFDLVYVPGWVSNVESMWEEPTQERFLRRLARFSRLILFDRRGTGLSDRVPDSQLPTLEERMDVPTLLLHRIGDRDANIEEARLIAGRIPGAKLVELEGQDHLPWVGDQDAVLDEVEEFLTGVRPLPEPDRVLATVLFTDIVGSTEKAAELGDRRWRDLLERHHAVVRRELARWRGREVDTAGDGFLATFDGPARAIRCACSIRDEVRALRLEVRAGVHTGECEVNGLDVQGIAVHIGARIAAGAAPSEVLVSSTVKDLVAGSGIEFEPRGVRELKGVPGEWNVFAVPRA